MERLLRRVLIISMLIFIAKEAKAQCPRNCQCYNSLINCNKGLTDIELKQLAQNGSDKPDRVRSLFLSYQKFDRLDLCLFRKFKSLREIGITFSDLKEIPRNMKVCLPNVNKVLLNNNLIEKILKEDFRDFGEVNSLDLSNNRISEIPERIFQNLSTLQEIKFKNNRIEIVFENAFFGLKYLRALDLSYNKISTIKRKVFTLEGVGALSLNGNRIKKIEEYAFAHQTIVKLDFNNNNISSFPIKTFWNSSITFLFVLKNPFSCSCSNLASVVQTNSLIRGTCFSPPDVHAEEISPVIRREFDPCIGLTICKGESQQYIDVLKLHLKSRSNFTRDCTKYPKHSDNNEKKKTNENMTLILSITIGILAVILLISIFIGYSYRRKYSKTVMVTSTETNDFTNNNKVDDKKANIKTGYVEALENSNDKEVTLKTMRRKISQVVFGRLTNNSNGLIPQEMSDNEKSNTEIKPPSNEPTNKQNPQRKLNNFHKNNFQPSINEETDAELTNKHENTEKKVNGLSKCTLGIANAGYNVENTDRL